jgi:cation:H+ antiporter
MIAVSALLTFLLVMRPTIGRGMGLVMLIAYVAYVVTAQG